MMDERRYTSRAQKLVLAGGGLLFLLILLAWISEGSRREWKKIQKAYRDIIVEQSGNSEAGMEVEKGIFQVELSQFSRNDRCISCHMGMEDERMADVPPPHGRHPGDFLKAHPVNNYGCTMCHGGQPQALSKKEAFGHEAEVHWPVPLLEQPYIQSSCGKCHLTVFDQSEEGSQAVEGMDVFLRGKDIFSREGCLGCHKARGVGGILGPDLTEQGEKTKHEYSFQNIEGDQSVSHWLKEHFRDPEMVSPGSQMLKINLEDSELEALATFVMGLAKPDIPFDYFSIETLNEFKGIRDSIPGATGFAYLCSSCHGKQGEGKSYKNYKTGIPSIGNTDFLRTASVDFIRYTIEKGRSLRQMASWTSGISGMSRGELDAVAVWLKNRPELPASMLSKGASGDALSGGILYDRHCQSCHGAHGKGGVALALDQEGMLQRAGDAFILETIYLGRGNTAMPGWYHLDENELTDLLTLIRSWGGHSRHFPITLPEADLEEGALKYHFLCSRCHGEFGQGETGPAIINRDFLRAADTRYLYETIAGGRAHTAMFGWSSDVYNNEKLHARDISNLIGFMRQESEKGMSYIFPGSNPGDRILGAEVFARRCAECHGNSGEGKEAPPLHNQELLSAASNGYLMATMTLGRKGTAMPAWGYKNVLSEALSQGEREALVAHIRSWQRIRIKY